MMPTFTPSGSSQMLRVCCPSTFMSFSGPCHSPAGARNKAGPEPVSLPCARQPDAARSGHLGGGMTIDYEAEYNNRARVPEHPDIMARWDRDAADYRAEAQDAGRAELGLSYGPT